MKTNPLVIMLVAACCFGFGWLLAPRQQAVHLHVNYPPYEVSLPQPQVWGNAPQVIGPEIWSRSWTTNVLLDL